MNNSSSTYDGHSFNACEELSQCSQHCSDAGAEDEEDTGTDWEPTTPKERFQATVDRIRSVADRSEQTYSALIAATQGFDRELAARLVACKQADEALFTHLASKGEQLPAPVVAALLGR